LIRDIKSFLLFGSTHESFRFYFFVASNLFIAPINKTEENNNVGHRFAIMLDNLYFW